MKAKMPFAPTVKLNNGMEMPILGLGTYAVSGQILLDGSFRDTLSLLQSRDNEAVEVIKHAIDNGYRHIDTALFYQNEAQVGQAIREKIADGTVKREDIFLVTKLWNTYHDPAKVEDGCRISLNNLGLDYIDLYLMHTPMGSKYFGDKFENLMPKDSEGNIDFSDVDYLDTWKAMEKLVEKGLVKAIGVSNFNSEQLARVLAEGSIKPVTNQVECNPYINQKEFTKFCKDRDVTLTAYTPLGHMKPTPSGATAAWQDERVIEIGKKYNKTPAQVILRYLIQLGVMPIPKSANKERVVQNINIFDFELTEDEVQVLDSFNSGERCVPFAMSTKHKYFPFSIPY